MSSRAALEASFLAAWPPGDAELSVYADILVGEGDPRGELIAIDLAPGARRSDDWIARRRAVVARWVGDDLVPAVVNRVSRGFLSVSAYDLGAILASPAGPYIHRLELHDDTMAPAALAHLAAARLPFLHTLSMAAHRGWFDQALVDRLCANAPALRVLVLEGNVVRSWVHPGITELDLRRRTPIPAGDYDAVTTLRVVSPRDLSAAQFPALRRLDLSRAEPAEVVLAELATTDLLARVDALELPALETQRAVDTLVALVRRYPTLRAIHAPRAHGTTAFDPSLAALGVGAPYPWRRDRRDQLFADLPDQGWTAIPAPLSELEARWDAMTPAEQRAWRELFRDAGDERSVALGAIRTAVGSLREATREDIAEKLLWIEHLADSVAVTVED